MSKILGILTLSQAEERFPEAIARLRQDRGFLKEGEAIVDQWDVFVTVEGIDEPDLVFANTLDQMSDVWDPVDGTWIEFFSDQWGFSDDDTFFRELEEFSGKRS